MLLRTISSIYARQKNFFDQCNIMAMLRRQSNLYLSIFALGMSDSILKIVFKRMFLREKAMIL